MIAMSGRQGLQLVTTCDGMPRLARMGRRGCFVLHKNSKLRMVARLLQYEKEYILISVSVGDTLDLMPIHICDCDPEVLVTKFVEKLKYQARRIRERVHADELLDDLELIPGSKSWL